jgi:hypothetical protein
VVSAQHAACVALVLIALIRLSPGFFAANFPVTIQVSNETAPREAGPKSKISLTAPQDIAFRGLVMDLDPSVFAGPSRSSPRPPEVLAR